MPGRGRRRRRTRPRSSWPTPASARAGRSPAWTGSARWPRSSSTASRCSTWRATRCRGCWSGAAATWSWSPRSPPSSPCPSWPPTRRPRPSGSTWPRPSPARCAAAACGGRRLPGPDRHRVHHRRVRAVAAHPAGPGRGRGRGDLARARRRPAAGRDGMGGAPDRAGRPGRAARAGAARRGGRQPGALMLVVTLGDLLLDVVVRLDGPAGPGRRHPGRDPHRPRRAGGQRRRVGRAPGRPGAGWSRRGPVTTAARWPRPACARHGVEVAGPELDGRCGVVVSIVAADGERSMLTDRGVSPELAAGGPRPGVARRLRRACTSPATA